MLKILGSRWFISLIGALLLSLLIWFLGPLLGGGSFWPLESVAARVIAILVVLVIWAVFNLVALLLTRKANERMINEIAAAPAAGPGSDATATAEEVALLRERLQEALGLLKKAKLGGASGRQYLYQLPWYIIIGPPGAGKTTALVNSGLTFPLADTFGKDRIKGVGGTRFCDWWFTDEAVLIDTAGRYTTQDSQQAVDAGAWTGFLGLLKKFRPRQPINGVLIAIGLDGFMQLSETDQMAHAAAIRQRLRELHKHLDVRFPVYVLFTKCDLVAGFVEFFDDLGREDREQVWGVSFPLDEGREEGGAVARYAAEFDLLVQRLNERLVERVHKEPDMLRRGLIFGFPAQIVSLKQATDDFLKAIFTPSRLEQRLLLRGVYFTSGTQEGTPIDRLMGAMAATFGLDRQRLSAFSGAGRSYFLTRLLRGVVFKEASVVSTDRRLERRRTWMRAGAYAAIALVTLAVTAAWAVSYLGNREMIDQTAAQVALYNQQVAGQDLGRVGDADVTRVLAPLNTLRAMPAGYAEHGRSVPLSLTFGLYQGNKLGAEAIRAYRRALNAMLLPRLLLGLERYLQSTNTEGEVYAALRVYLMLGNRGPLDRGEVTAWMDAAWSGYPTEIRQQLLDHLAALLEVDEQPLIEIPLDGNVIAQAQQVLSRLSQAEIALNKLAQSPAARQVPPWRIADVQGTNTVFVRRSGRPLTEGWPGLYTYNGFHLVFLPALRDVARETARESWVFGRRPGPQTGIGMLDDNDPQVLGLRREVMNLYLDRYSTQWNTVLRDIAIVPFHNRDQQVQVLNQLSGRSSPLRSLLRAISRETTLTAPLESTLPPGTDTAVVAASREAQRYVPNNAVGRIGTAFFGAGQPAAGQAAEPPGKSIDDEFRWLHDLTGTGDGTGTGAGAGAGGGGAGASPLDDIIGTMNDLMQQMAGPRIGANPAGAPPPGGGPAQRLQLQTQQVP